MVSGISWLGHCRGICHIIEKADENYYSISSKAWMANRLLRDNRGNDEKYRFIFDMITKTCARP